MQVRRARASGGRKRACVWRGRRSGCRNAPKSALCCVSIMMRELACVLWVWGRVKRRGLGSWQGGWDGTAPAGVCGADDRSFEACAEERVPGSS